MPAQHLVATRDHAVERIRDVEERGVAVGHGAVEREQVGRHCVEVARSTAALQDLDGRPRPHRPVAEQAADEAQLAGLGAERHREVEHDVVVVTGVEGDPFLRACSGHAVDDVEGAVAVERGDLDPDHVLDRREAPPERAREDDAPDGRLQVEADHWQLVGERAAVGEHRVLARVAERGEAHEHRVVAEVACDPGLGDGLLGRGRLTPATRKRGRVVHARAVSAASSSTGR